MAAGIYRIVRLDNGRSYVGSAVDLQKRWSVHLARLRSRKHHSRELQAAWSKYGESAFQFEVIEHITDPAALIAREQFWIDKLDAYASGYNECPVASNSLGYRHTPEARAKMRAAKLGKASPRRGAYCSPETRARISAAKLGWKPPRESVERIAAKNRGKKRSPETCRRISEAKRRASK